MLFAVSDVVWQALIAAVVAIYLEWSRRKTAEKVQEVANKQEKAEEKNDKTTAAVVGKLNDMAEVGTATHALCNSGMRAQKQLLATAARALASRSGNTEDEEAAAEAERDLREHDKKQRKTDKNGPIPPL